jgi:hypothetical protein
VKTPEGVLLPDPLPSCYQGGEDPDSIRMGVRPARHGDVLPRVQGEVDFSPGTATTGVLGIFPQKGENFSGTALRWFFRFS